jgi:hypothetical protein
MEMLIERFLKPGFDDRDGAFVRKHAWCGTHNHRFQDAAHYGLKQLALVRKGEILSWKIEER